MLKTSTRQTVFLPVVGLVDAAALKPGDLVGVNKVRAAVEEWLMRSGWGVGWTRSDGDERVESDGGE